MGAVRSEMDPVRSEMDPVRSEMDPVRSEMDPVRSEGEVMSGTEVRSLIPIKSCPIPASDGEQVKPPRPSSRHVLDPHGFGVHGSTGTRLLQLAARRNRGRM
jgi:hypothetical protein